MNIFDKIKWPLNDIHKDIKLHEDIIIPINQFTDQLIYHSTHQDTIYFITKTYLTRETQDIISDFFNLQRSNNFKKYHKKHFPNPKHYMFCGGGKVKGSQKQIVISIMKIKGEPKMMDYNFGGEIVKIKYI